ncbi:uncharacterized protein LOC110111277 [Dendrobium catenatum]|uniref:Replication factor A C-terminal domain-containing protein n=1 Tax=Dendrobium catenatum TaxID=906689 RepID=A0A2I0WTD2_9ASPA|nr:uncharacterized protein LOC110111277 [Dendrobium catenatum]PKU78911.1 hypothetical protein MA16_Dca000255 [Dendrobium catenatum]
MQNINGDGGGSRSNKPWTPTFCTIIDAETTSFSYLACSNCERVLPNDSLPNPPTCAVCSNKYTFPTASKRLYRLLLSIAISDKVIPVMCFDRAARVLVGCSADELFNFCKSHPFAEEKMGEILEGEMCQMTLCEPKNGNAQHLRVVSVVPLRAGFRPAIHTLRLLYGVDNSHRSSN